MQTTSASSLRQEREERVRNGMGPAQRKQSEGRSAAVRSEAAGRQVNEALRHHIRSAFTLRGDVTEVFQQRQDMR